jgi:biopolymer transport protein ExbB/TolQ
MAEHNLHDLLAQVQNRPQSAAAPLAAGRAQRAGSAASRPEPAEPVHSGSRTASFAEWVLRLPLLWGGVACLGFYALLNRGVIESPLVTRYFASHPVEYITCALFFVGLAALVMRLLNLTGQFATLNRQILAPVPQGGQSIADCDKLLGQLALLPASAQRGYLVGRLREAIEFIRRKDSADTLDQYLRHLEELDMGRMNAGYSIVRIVIWAIPILGFLGTVIGITMAIANLSPQALEKSLPEVTHGLGVAFDTTALALALSMVLMFVKFGVERVEDRLLLSVDNRTSDELVGRFQETGMDSDPNVAAVRRMAEQVLGAIETMTDRQAQVWKSSIDETHAQWAEVSTAAGEIIKQTLDSSLQESLEHHAERLNQGVQLHASQLNQGADKTLGRLREGLEKLAELLVEAMHEHGEVMIASEKELAQENRRHLAEVEAALGESMVVSADRQEQLIKQNETMLREMQVAMVEAAGATVRQQEQLVRQGDVLLRVVDATGQIKKLEDTLNDNLAALDKSHHFQESALTLSAAIQLLCARLDKIKPVARTVDLSSDHSASHAA